MSTPGSSAVIRFPASLIDAEVLKELQDYGVEFKEPDPREQEHILEIEGDLGNIEAEIEEGIFRLHDSEAQGGEFDSLEEMLKTKGIPWDRESAMDWQIAPCLVVFRPATGGKAIQYLWFPLDPETDEPVMKVSRLRDFLNKTEVVNMGKMARFLAEEFPAYPPLSDFVKEG